MTPPDVIDRVINALFKDLDDRKGLEGDIRADWRRIIEREVLPAGEVIDRGWVTGYTVAGPTTRTDPLQRGNFEVQFDGSTYHHKTASETMMRGIMQRQEIPAEVVLVLLPKHALEIHPRDGEWSRAFVDEFKIGGAIFPHDDQWVKEKKTLPERWARIVRLATTPPGVKLHDYLPPQPVKLDPESA